MREGLSINLNKAEMVLFTKKRKVGNIPRVSLFGKDLVLKKSVKYLGVSLMPN